ncbi:hypothetical protein B0H13DRAFT_1905491 [Mycena leptocephala]|nr:hypothetical protein B0H13DRAFT_1905491 [Mycena leptocephala]
MRGKSCKDVEEQAGRIRWTAIKQGGRLVARRCGKLRNKLNGGSSGCPESQSDGTASNGTAWSALAVTVRSRREGVNGGDRLRVEVSICSQKRIDEFKREGVGVRCGIATRGETNKERLKVQRQGNCRQNGSATRNSRTRAPVYDEEEPDAIPPPATRITELQSEGSDSAAEDN